MLETSAIVKDEFNQDEFLEQLKSDVTSGKTFE